jgi:hypothetical protein
LECRNRQLSVVQAFNYEVAKIPGQYYSFFRALNMKRSICLFLLTTFSILIGYLLYIFLSHWGIHLASDGAWYCSYAIQMHHLGDYACVAEAWPPLYPFVLHLFMFLEPLPKDAAVLLSAVTISLSLISITLIQFQFGIRNCLSLASLFVLLVSPGFLDMHLHALSESVFVLIVLWHIFFISLHWITRRLIYFLFAVILLSLLPLIRYIGYAIYFAPVLYIILFCCDEYKKRLWVMIMNMLLMFMLGGFAALLLPIYKHFANRPLLFGKRIVSNESLVDLVEKFIQSFPHHIFVMALVILFILGLGFLYKNKGINPLTKNYFIIGCYTAIISMSYMGALLISKTRYLLDPINLRLLTPFTVFLCTSLFILIYSIPSEFEKIFVSTHLRVGRKWGFVFLFGTLGVLFSIFMPSTLGHVSKVEYFSERPYTPPYLYGFSQSNTASRFAALLDTLMNEKDSINVGGVVGYRKSSQSPHFPQSLLYSKEAFSDLGWHDFKIDNVNPSPYRPNSTGRNGLDFTVSFYDKNNAQKSICYISPPVLLDNEHLQNVVLAILKRQEASEFHLFVSDPIVYKRSIMSINKNVTHTNPELKSISSEMLTNHFFHYHFKK